MASATFENTPTVRAVRAAIWAERARRHSAPAREQSERDWRREARPRGRARRALGIWRGVGASAAIAGGYVAVIAGLRWALTAAG
jgi:hypothetical protein